MLYRVWGKRIIDLILVLVSAVLWVPVVLLCGGLIYLSMGRPVLFLQKRPGLGGKIFTLFKLRTMNEGSDSDAERVTRLGTFLRKSSFDELPSLFNVLRGDMSLIGPRPLLPQYLERYTPEQMHRHDVLPGLTGLAQIEGRQNIPFSKRLELDVQYADHVSFSLDVVIFFRTIRIVITGKDVVVGQEVTEVDDLGLYRA